ncbi:MAG: hypothetical protein ABI818_08070 [Acidobacteriota bacterium]
MAEVLVEFSEPVSAKDGRHYVARACGGETDTNLWQGWIEFLPVDEGEPVRSGRETTQPNRQDAEYWATGLTAVYLEGALNRALNPLARKSSPAPAAPSFDGPAPAIAAPPRQEAVLNPFSVYRKGEALLRSQLTALSVWHLVNIIAAYDLSAQSQAALGATPASALVELIVTSVAEGARTDGR